MLTLTKPENRPSTSRPKSEKRRDLSPRPSRFGFVFSTAPPVDSAQNLVKPANLSPRPHPNWLRFCSSPRRPTQIPKNPPICHPTPTPRQLASFLQFASPPSPNPQKSTNLSPHPHPAPIGFVFSARLAAQPKSPKIRRSVTPPPTIPQRPSPLSLSSPLIFRKAHLQAVIAFMLLFAPMLSAEMLRIEASVEAMGSAYSIVAYDEDRYALQNAVDAAFDEVRRLDALLSNYKPASELSKINQLAGDHPVVVSREVFDLLSACLEYSRLSDGAFDITVGDLMKVWGFYKGSGRMPKPGEVQQALKTVGWRKVRLDAGHRTVFFTEKGVELDPGGIGKGYAVDRMVAILKEKGLKSALITAGGSSIYGLGAPPGEKGWTIDIRNPSDESKPEGEVVLKDQSMSTSGSYEKFFTADGKIYSHIMDPRTGYPAMGMISVSVIASRTLDSEAWTKPFFINGREWASKHQPPGVRVFLCEDKKEHTCAWLQ
jgi:thiamine biosynthesis lipoprotein